MEFRGQVPAWWKGSEGPRACAVWTYKGKPQRAEGPAGRQDQACVLGHSGSLLESWRGRGLARGRPSSLCSK